MRWLVYGIMHLIGVGAVHSTVGKYYSNFRISFYPSFYFVEFIRSKFYSFDYQ